MKGSRKGGMIMGSSLHKHSEKLRIQKEGYKNLADGRSPSSAFQHIVDDNPEHQAEPPTGYTSDHPEDLNTEAQHVKWLRKQKSEAEGSPMNILGAAAGFAAGRLMGGRKDEGPQELLEGTGKTVEKVTGYKVSGGEGEPEGAGDMPSVDDEVIDEGMAIE